MSNKIKIASSSLKMNIFEELSIGRKSRMIILNLSIKFWIINSFI